MSAVHACAWCVASRPRRPPVAVTAHPPLRLPRPHRLGTHQTDEGGRTLPHGMSGDENVSV